MPDQPMKSICPPAAPVAALGQALAGMDPRLPPGQRLQRLIDAGLDRLPLPAGGDTLRRWECLALVARHDLSLLKLYEGHTDALAILAELDAASMPLPRSAWGVWCAEPPGVGLTLRRAGASGFVLSGRKHWCSGAAAVSHALVSCRDDSGGRRLAAVAMLQPGVAVTEEGWHAVGMAACDSVDVAFDDAPAVPVGDADAYLNRPGFWHGGAGIAACWYGAAQSLADYLHAAVRGQAAADPFRLAHLGEVDIAMQGAAALLRETAAAIDADPYADASTPALRVRLAVEAAASTVLRHVTRALGAGPLCRDAAFARMAADLPVFLRQSHAERDLATLGGMLAKQEHSSWLL
jgi:alkylation response protein AidB-like acyl-CoA dehydrogenase